MGIFSADGAPFGSNKRTLTDGTLETASSISGLTSDHSSPPLPHPRGGITIEAMPNSWISLINESKPALMSSIRDASFQCLLVGKLTMNFGLSDLFVGTINILP